MTDLVDAHVAAMGKLRAGPPKIYNVGTGKGQAVALGGGGGGRDEGLGCDVYFFVFGFRVFGVYEAVIYFLYFFFVSKYIIKI